MSKLVNKNSRNYEQLRACKIILIEEENKWLCETSYPQNEDNEEKRKNFFIF